MDKKNLSHTGNTYVVTVKPKHMDNVFFVLQWKHACSINHKNNTPLHTKSRQLEQTVS